MTVWLGDDAAIEKSGAVLGLTLSNVVVVRLPSLSEDTAIPTKTLEAMLIVAVAPTCDQVAPSLDAKAVNVFADRTSFSQ